MEVDRDVTTENAERLRRRGVLGASAAVAVLLLGGGLVTSQVLAGGGNDSSTGDHHLAVQVDGQVPHSVAALAGKRDNGQAGLFQPIAVWDPRARTLIYVSGIGYSSSCPPDAAARVTDDGVDLDLVDATQNKSCTADATRVAVRMRGFTRSPDTLTATGLGRTSTIPVLVAADGIGGGDLPSRCGTEPGLFCSSASPQP